MGGRRFGGLGLEGSVDFLGQVEPFGLVALEEFGWERFVDACDELLREAMG